MNQYIVTPAALVYVVTSTAKAKALAASIEGSVIATDKDLSAISSKLLVQLHNRINPEKPITKFSDRATAEKRMAGVLDALAQKPTAKMTEEILDAPMGTPTSPTTEKVKKEKKVKEPKAPKEKKERESKKEITDDILKRVIELRKDGKSWSDVVHILGESTNFIHRVRPLLREKEPTMVKNLGPGSETYGKRKSGELPATKRASRRSTRENTTPTMEF